MITLIIGIAAALLSVVSFLPQAWKIIRTRKTDELATGMWMLNVVGFGLWATYGILLGVWAIVVPNLVCLVLSGFILTMKLVSPRTRHAIADVLDPAVDASAARAAQTTEVERPVRG